MQKDMKIIQNVSINKCFFHLRSDLIVNNKIHFYINHSFKINMNVKNSSNTLMEKNSNQERKKILYNSS